MWDPLCVTEKAVAGLLCAFGSLGKWLVWAASLTCLAVVGWIIQDCIEGVSTSTWLLQQDRVSFLTWLLELKKIRVETENLLEI